MSMGSKKRRGNGGAQVQKTAPTGLVPEILLGESSPGPVLVVEDDEATREMLRYLVTTAGCSAVTAANGREALEYLGRAALPCLILLDLMMPVMDGCALDQKLAADSRFSLIPVVVITAFPERATGLERHLKIIQKPLEISEIINLIKSYCC
jgi:CheY-like chemotaxis protein